MVATLINDLETAAHDLVLVLDDYHLIESPEIHESVAFLLEHLPPQIRLVIATRADPPLPLASLRADGDLLEVRAADLRFTPDEAGSYLSDAMDLTLTAADVEVLDARTEGWIAALQLAALSMQGRDDPSSFVAEFAGDDRFILDYLADEVLERQTPDDPGLPARAPRSCPRLTGPLCAAVTGREDAKAILEQLERSNLFLVAARRPPHLVPVPPPLRRRPPGEAPRRPRRAGAGAAPSGERLVRRPRRALRSHHPGPRRRPPRSWPQS